MPRLKAATVADRTLPKKRKRGETDPEDGPQPDANGGVLPAADGEPAGTKTRKNPQGTRKSSAAPLASISWPEHFTRLSQTHRALNLVFTFCCTRKHLATTFANIKSAVEAHTKRPLAVEDIAQIKALIPQRINFAYVDEAMLQVHVQGDPQVEDKGHGKDVLLFEFIDGDLKRQVQDPKTGEVTQPFRRLRDEDLKMPVYSQKQMTKLINKRNDKFAAAVNDFLRHCQDAGLDPVQALQAEHLPFIPIPPEAVQPWTSHNSSMPSTIPKDRETISEIISELTSSEWYTDQIVTDGHRVFDPETAVYGEVSFQFSQNLVNALYNTRGITQLYSHQAEAINTLYEGNNVIVATSTSSGKSLIYQIPGFYMSWRGILIRERCISSRRKLWHKISGDR